MDNNFPHTHAIISKQKLHKSWKSFFILLSCMTAVTFFSPLTDKNVVQKHTWPTNIPNYANSQFIPMINPRVMYKYKCPSQVYFHQSWYSAVSFLVSDPFGDSMHQESDSVPVLLIKHHLIRSRSAQSFPSLFLVLLTGHYISLGYVERRWVAVCVGRVFKQHRVVVLGLQFKQ